MLRRIKSCVITGHELVIFRPFFIVIVALGNNEKARVYHHAIFARRGGDSEGGFTGPEFGGCDEVEEVVCVWTVLIVEGSDKCRTFHN